MSSSVMLTTTVVGDPSRNPEMPVVDSASVTVSSVVSVSSHAVSVIEADVVFVNVN